MLIPNTQDFFKVWKWYFISSLSSSCVLPNDLGFYILSYISVPSALQKQKTKMRWGSGEGGEL